jgi:choline-phosphate cytidylyltransferase/glycerol-3-phosphate cytidylyltransferase
MMAGHVKKWQVGLEIVTINQKNECMIIGYTTGVYDLFHIGHLNLLKNAKGMCDYLVVGVTVDELVAYKGKHAMIPFEDRIEIVRSCKYVDAAVPQYDMDKLTACKKLGATMLFVGDDWYGTDKWKEYEKRFDEEGIRIVYFPYTKGISSTKITQALQQVRGWTNETAQKMFHLNLEDSENDR